MLSASAFAVAAGAGGPMLDEAEALRTSQAAIGRRLGGYDLVDQHGRPLRLESLRGRPVVLSLIYTSCYHVCSGVTLHLKETVRIARDALGTGSFSVVTVGFDAPNDTPDRMRMYASERRMDVEGWYFASADAATIAHLARDVGFTWIASPKGFDHLTQATIVDAEGRVALQVYGPEFPTPQLVEPLKKLVWGRNLDRTTVTGLVNSVKLICTIYDPQSGRYRFDYSLFVNVFAGLLALGMIAVAILRSLRNLR